MSQAVGVDDHALGRIPEGERYAWFSVAVQRFGQMSALSQFLLGSTLGFGMKFWDAFWALTLGAVILEVVTIFIGVIGVREGMSTSMIARWTGFGQGGASLIGLVIAISLVGWFGIQSQISAQGLTQLVGGLPEWGWSLVFGLGVTAIVVFGFKSMAWTAYLTVPLFLTLVTWSVSSGLAGHSLGALVDSAAPGPHISLVQGTALVAGSFIIGAVVTPDMTRFNRTTADVVKQTVVGITLGEYAIGLAGVLLAHAVGTGDIIAIVTSSVGWVGVLVILFGTFKINDWNLYSAGLGVVNFTSTVFGRSVPRGVATLAVGVAGSLLAAGGVLSRFTDFLILLGVAFPPISGIMIAEYFVVRRWRTELDEGRAANRAPRTAPTWVPATVVIWLVSALVAKYATFGLGSVNALVLAFVLYVIAGKLHLVRGVGKTATEATTESALTPDPAAGV
ncbi:purine-cytosine permease family protein [Streptomyces coffeae]|uniref:Cytosine permease n=1 Tax=Streptomyces coffeae TaxID=621382 RepID=A0ABS1NNH2_9ACTN|nr:cytosine permease [Streptomyces coffeae]MBL1101489.1 cytosine permease [Streptomyces coffeae]